MILLFFIALSLVQLSLYRFKEKFTFKISDYFILVIALIGYYFIIPPFFYPEPRPDGINCGMPILGLTLGFLFFGTISAIITHIVWVFGIKRNIKEST